MIIRTKYSVLEIYGGGKRIFCSKYVPRTDIFALETPYKSSNDDTCYPLAPNQGNISGYSMLPLPGMVRLPSCLHCREDGKPQGESPENAGYVHISVIGGLGDVIVWDKKSAIHHLVIGTRAVSTLPQSCVQKERARS